MTTQAIPLVRADLTVADEQAVRAQLVHAPFVDDPLLLRWESAWERLWQRPALAFADPAELILALKSVLGWRDGVMLRGTPLMDPAWTEALTKACLPLTWCDIDLSRGQGIFAWDRLMPSGSYSGTLQAEFWVHPYGIPTSCQEQGVPFWLEEISSILQPMPGCGWGDVQLLYLSGNSMVAAGASCLLLTRDEALSRALRKLRHYPPSPMACALGLSQLKGLNARLERRRVLAERYQTLLRKEYFPWPEDTTIERVWAMFLLDMNSEMKRKHLKNFLRKSHIHADSPLWFQTKHTEHLPGFQRFQARILALPLYASLKDGEHKRVINRVNRWASHVAKHGVSFAP